jgi:hypothetical protein
VQAIGAPPLSVIAEKDKTTAEYLVGGIVWNELYRLKVALTIIVTMNY